MIPPGSAPGVGPMTAGDLRAWLADRPDDSVVLAMVPASDERGERSLMVIEPEVYLNPAGREVIHLHTFDYEAAEG